MKDKENETITIKKFIEILENMLKHFGNRITYIRMTEEFYNHLFIQSEHLNGTSLNHILGITIIKIPNGKLEGFYNGGLVDWEIIPIGTKC